MAYGSDQALIDYLALSGRVLPVTAVPAVVRYWGSAYVNIWEDKYKGKPLASPDSFPRDIYDPTPVAVEHAAYEAGYAWLTLGDVIFGSGGTEGGQVVREKVDVLEVQYAEPKAGMSYFESGRYVIPLAYALLLPFMKSARGFGAVVIAGNRCGC